MKRRVPQFSLAPGEVAFYEAKVGFLRPEECIRQHLYCAAERGAELRFEEPVLSWTASDSGEGVSVVTAKQAYRAKSLVVSAGSWASEMIEGLGVPLAVVRRVMFWFRPSAQPSAFDAEVFPVFLWEPEEGPFFYGIPRIDAGGDPKAAIHWGAEVDDEPCTPATIDRAIHARDEAAIRSALASRIPWLNSEIAHAATCMYTMTPDTHFVIDAHPRHAQVFVAAGFSGHGFKFSAAVGEILADLALTRRTSSDITLFSASRFSRP